MTDESLGSRGATLLQTGEHGATASAVRPATYPMGTSVDDGADDSLPLLVAARVELSNGNVDSAIRLARIVSGRSARLGDRQVAGLVRKAAWIAPFGQIESARDLIAQATVALRNR